MVPVAYERWTPTRGSKYSDLTWKLLVFWKTGRLREVVTTGGSTVFKTFYWVLKSCYCSYSVPYYCKNSQVSLWFS